MTRCGPARASARELDAHWHIDQNRRPVLNAVGGGRIRPNTPAGRQQVQLRVDGEGLEGFDYLFEKAQTE